MHFFDHSIQDGQQSYCQEEYAEEAPENEVFNEDCDDYEHLDRAQRMAMASYQQYYEEGEHNPEGSSNNDILQNVFLHSFNKR